MHGPSYNEGHARGYALGYQTAQLQAEHVRQLLTGWRPFAYVCAGFLVGFVLRGYW
jgi:hypothetical protein